MKKTIIALLLMAGIAYATTNEISVSTFLKVNKNAVQLDRTTGTILLQMAGARYNVQTLAANETLQYLSKGSVGTPGWAFMRNLSTNTAAKVYITFDGGVTTSMVLNAKEPALFRVAPTALITNWTASAASTNAVDFEFTVIEN